MKAEVVVDGIGFGEGPVWCPAGSVPERSGGTLVVTSVSHGALFRVWPEAGRKEQLADTGGGANGAALASDGGFLVTQNGGIDMSGGVIDVGDLPAVRHVTPGLQRVSPDGNVSYLADDGFNAPNDLVVDADGVVYFTDPGHYPPPNPPIGRVMARDPDGGLRVVASDFWFCNGIAFDLEGNLVVIERAGLQRLNPDGSREWVIERIGRGGGDGFCLDSDGRYYVCATVEHGVRVIDRDGDVVDFLEIPGDGVTTNCCFGGPGNRSLFATDAVPGHVVVWEGLPTPGLPLHPWPAPLAAS